MTVHITEDQHYVPQFLLRGFSASTDKINIFDLKKNEFRFNQAIKKKFYEKFFYDTDNQLENMLALLETKTSPVIDRIREDAYIRLEESEEQILIQFLCTQFSRTKVTRDLLLKMYDEIMMEEVKAIFAKEFPEETDFGYFDYKKEDLRKFSSISTAHGTLNAMVMNDLKFHVLINKTSMEFIISDHPMVVNNELYKKERQYFPGPLARGAQLFLPLSRNTCLCAYDPKVYKYGGQKSLIASELVNIQDVNWLNTLQILSADRLIGFSSEFMEGTIRNLRSHKEKSAPSFFKILKRAKKLYKTPQIRNLQNYLEFLKFLKNQKGLIKNPI